MKLCDTSMAQRTPDALGFRLSQRTSAHKPGPAAAINRRLVLGVLVVLSGLAHLEPGSGGSDLFTVFQGSAWVTSLAGTA